MQPSDGEIKLMAAKNKAGKQLQFPVYRRSAICQAIGGTYQQAVALYINHGIIYKGSIIAAEENIFITAVTVFPFLEPVISFKNYGIVISPFKRYTIISKHYYPSVAGWQRGKGKRIPAVSDILPAACNFCFKPACIVFFAGTKKHHAQ